MSFVLYSHTLKLEFDLLNYVISKHSDNTCKNAILLLCDSVNRQARHEQTTIFRMRTGRCGLRAHLKRIGIMDSTLCDCKEAEQTVHHILQDCPVWRKQRHQLWPQDESTTNKLWGTAEDLRRTTQFLATCGLRVQARLINCIKRNITMCHFFTESVYSPSPPFRSEWLDGNGLSPCTREQRLKIICPCSGTQDEAYR